MASAGKLQAGTYLHDRFKTRGEHKGLESAFNPNTFTAEMTDTEGNPVGRFSASQIELENDFTVAIAEGLGNGETEWEFTWWAPEVAVSATLYIAMLDGDGASDPERRFIDPLRCPLPIEPAEDRSPAGCWSGGSSGGAGFALLFFILTHYLRARRPVIRTSTG